MVSLYVIIVARVMVRTLGVVLTPSHITELFCDLIELKPSDTVFDPCCGTGGFLITAMHKMLKQAKPSEAYNIKADRIHGIEIRGNMLSLLLQQGYDFTEVMEQSNLKLKMTS